MPKKGLPRCRCGCSRWWLVRDSPGSGQIMCYHCYRVIRTKSKKRHRLPAMLEEKWRLK